LATEEINNVHTKALRFMYPSSTILPSPSKENTNASYLRQATINWRLVFGNWLVKVTHETSSFGLGLITHRV